jgi:hypothetical protein
VAYGLLIATMLLQEQLRELQEREGDPKVISDDGHYAITRFDQADDGKPLGRIIASRIPNLGDARRMEFVLSRKAIELVRSHEELIVDKIQQLEGSGDDTTDREIQLASAERIELLLSDYDKWVSASKRKNRDELIGPSAAS